VLPSLTCFHLLYLFLYSWVSLRLVLIFVLFL
jgi:hypothetical protein